MKISILLAALTTLVAAAPSRLETRQSSTNTYNEASGSAPCKPVAIFFARGTTEDGNVGSYVGPPLFDALLDAGINIARQGVNDYPADVAGFFAGGSESGARWMKNAVNTYSSRCPQSKIVMSGYSQGAQVTHKAAPGVSNKQKVVAIVLFGDPNEGDPINGYSSDKILTICNDGDLICDGQSIILTPHLTYDERVGEAVDFIEARI